MNGTGNYPAAGDIFLENVILKVSQTHFSKDFYSNGGHKFFKGRQCPPKGAVKYPTETTVNSMLLCHAMSGCDTTSRFFGFGKIRLFKSKIQEKMPTSTAEFYCRQQTVDRVVEAGTNIMITMYAKLGKLTDTSLLTLDKLRHKMFLSSLHHMIGSVQKKVDHRQLPSTSLAAKYHSLRVHHQIQEWLFNPLYPSEYGWILNSGGKYEPKYTDKAVAPLTLLKLVSCGCKSDCYSKRCGCKQLDFQCSDYCGCGCKQLDFQCSDYCGCGCKQLDFQCSDYCGCGCKQLDFQCSDYCGCGCKQLDFQCSDTTVDADVNS